MGKTIKVIILGLLIVIATAAGARQLMQPTSSVQIAKPTAVPTQVKLKVDTFSYKGEDGKDALTILKEKTKVEQEKSGLVVTIGNRKAENAKKEFWAFYVNGKFADVGPAEYQTKDTDKIEWKIENY